MSIDPNQETMVVPSNIDFATDVKADRLEILWRVTFGASIAVLLLMFTFVTTESLSVEIWVMSPIALAIFCYLTGMALRREYYDTASVLYALGGMAAVTVGLFARDPTTRNIVPYFFVVVIFMAGLLLRPSQTLGLTFAAAAFIVLVPALTEDLEQIGVYQVVAIVLIFIAALMAAQVTGELYQVTEWALSNYQRERATNSELFDNRAELQKSLKRSEVLSERLQESNTELEVARQSAEVAKTFRGQFLANMSHELRTPLNAIIGFSETMLKFPMMYDDTELPTAYRADLTQIHTSGQQLLSLINDILDLARVDAGKLEIYMERVELESILDGVLATANGLIGNKPIELRLDLPDPLPNVWADQNRVRQVLLNLYSNASKFTDAGSITLSIREMPDGVRFSVKDTGFGIPKDQQAVIFEEFRQVSNTGGRDPRAGSGLGLAICRQLLDLMRGRIWVDSEVGKGSTFHFVLQPYHKDTSVTTETQTIPVDAVVTDGETT